MANQIKYCAFPDAIVLDKPEGKPVQHLLWGDWLRLKGGKEGDGFEVDARGEDGWLHKESIQDTRLLEIVFVDIGQGDGCIVSTPEDKHIVIDAGEGDNMYRFLRWRFGKFSKKFKFESLIISHPDVDHYGGFVELFEEKNIEIGVVYHSGIIERTNDVRGPFGKTQKFNRKSYLAEIIRDKSSLDSLLTKKAIGGKKYPKMLRNALDSGRVGDFVALDSDTGYLPGYEAQKDITIEILGPVPTNLGSEKKGLKTFGSAGETKNGHSVILKLTYHNVSILLGGDLNIPAECHLLTHYTGINVPPKDADEEELLVTKARRTFQVDFAKACHHGSADFSEIFLKAVNARATVISSGDDEAHAHPRADTLGTLGKHARGRRPLIFSTELARSAKETIKRPEILRSQLREAARELHDAQNGSNEENIKKAEKKYEELLSKVDRSIAVFGAINIRTDGNQVIFAQKIEAPSDEKKKKWDIYKFLRNARTGELEYDSKH